MAIVSSQGSSFTYNGASYIVTSIAVNYGGSDSSASSDTRQRVSAAHLDSDPEKPEPFFEVWQPDEIGKGRLIGVVSTTATSTTATATLQHTVDIEFLGVSPPTYGSSGSLVIGGPISLTFVATCKSSTVRATVGDVVRGTASFKVA